MKKIFPLLLSLICSFSGFSNNSYNVIEAITKPAVNELKSVIGTEAPAGSIPAIIIIPVVVHVLYNNLSQNISDAQVLSQIDALNKDYRGTNTDRIRTPAYFAPLAADAGFEFRLAKIDQEGYATTGIVRKQTKIQMFGLDDRIKSGKIGGDDAWDSKKYLNIWVGNIAGGIIGYTSKPGGPAEVDGVVINTSAFGTTGTAAAPYNLGRTATHEIGHWLNLRHIWGDTYCGDDEVDDTPQQRSSNRGSPTGEHFSCGTTPHGDMYMNFMDLTNDASMFMFTSGQSQRMRASFAAGGPHHEMLSSNALTGTPIAQALKPAVLPAPAVSDVQISLYPNPAESVITLTINGGENPDNKPITIYNNVGQPVITLTMTSNRITINISQLAAGVYFVRQGSGGTVVMTKFVKK